MSERHVLVVRLDNAGDVLLTGPTVRRVAASGAHVTFLAGPGGRSAAELLPGVDRVVTWEAPWILADPPPVDRTAIDRLLAVLAGLAVDDALVLTSYHQSPLPMALLLRMVGVGRIAATSVDYPGSLLDERLPYLEALHEVEQNLTVAESLGYRLGHGDDGRLAVQAGAPPALDLPDRYVAVHPMASVPARGVPLDLVAGVVRLLVDDGRDVVLTGSAADRAVTRPLAGEDQRVHDLAGRTDLGGLADVFRHADALVVGNTGPAHLAASVGTPVVSVFAPVVAPHRWAPWRVPHRLLGHLDIACAGCRSRRCPIEGQPCVGTLTPGSVLRALASLQLEVGRPAGTMAS